MLDLSIVVVPLIAGMLVVATHVPLGREVLARGIIFIDLAVAQIAGLGVIAAGALHLEFGGYGVQLAAATSALGGSLLLQWTERHWPEIQEALIGTVFVLAAAASVLLLAHNPHGAERLQDLLTGQILWVRPNQLISTGALYLLVLSVWFAAPHFARRSGFYLLFALTVTASVQLVGIYLVFATLIIPALTVRRLTSGRGLWIAYVAATAGYLSGLLLSLGLDLPAAPLIVWSLAVCGLIGASIIAVSLSRRADSR